MTNNKKIITIFTSLMLPVAMFYLSIPAAAQQTLIQKLSLPPELRQKIQNNMANTMEQKVSTSSADLNTDYLQKYEQQKLKGAREMVQSKRKVVMLQRQACAKSVASYQKQRAQEMTQLRKSLQEQQVPTEQITQQVSTFRAETQAKVLEMRLACKNAEKKVLTTPTPTTTAQ